MASIYNIQQDLFDIFNQLEENGGEITPELEEKLVITQAEFKDKIKAYADVLKQLDLDLAGIKAEKERLDALKVSKEKTIERLKRVMADAISMFGDTTKTGGKFIDYGTGKISIRRSESIELDDDRLQSVSDKFIAYFNWLKFTNTFDQAPVTVADIIDYCNHTSKGSDYDEDLIQSEITEDDFNKIKASLSFNIDFKEIINTEEGKALIRALVNYSTLIKVKPVIDKKAIKDEIASKHTCPTFAKLVVKENINIK